MNIGEKLRELRHEKRETLEQVASAVNVVRGAVSNWELGLREPNLDTVIALARHFEVSVGVLLGEEPPAEGRAA